MLELLASEPFWTVGTLITAALFAYGMCREMRQCRYQSTLLGFLATSALLSFLTLCFCWAFWPLFWPVAFFEMINRA